MANRALYASIFVALWAIYLFVNRHEYSHYIYRRSDAGLDDTNSATRNWGWMALWSILGMLAGAVALYHRGGISGGGPFLRPAPTAGPSEEQLEQLRLARVEQMQRELDANRRQYREEDTIRQVEGVPGGMAAEDRRPSVTQQLSASGGTPAERQHRHAEWLHRMQAENDSTATQQLEQAKQQRLQALQQGLLRIEEGRAHREAEQQRVREEAERIEERRVQEQLAQMYERELRAEQDREYEESLDQDQRLRAEREAAAAAEEQARKSQQARDDKRQTQMQGLKDLKRALRAQLKEEPEVGSAGVVAVRVRLPQGGVHMRRFAEATSMQEVKDWVQSLEDFPPWHPQQWQLVNSYPKVALDGGMDLSSVADGCPQISLFVENVGHNTV